MKVFKEIFDELAKQKDLFFRIKSRMVLREWEKIVGKRIAKHTIPQIKEDALIVICDDPIWLTEISFFKDEIKRRFNELAGIEVVKKVILKRR